MCSRGFISTSGVNKGIKIRGWRGYQNPGLARVSIFGVNKGINSRGKRGYQYPGLTRVSIAGVSEVLTSGVGEGSNIRVLLKMAAGVI